MAIAKRELGRTGLQVTTLGSIGALNIIWRANAAVWLARHQRRAAKGAHTSSRATTSWRELNKVLHG
jgi:hypothetical protein